MFGESAEDIAPRLFSLDHGSAAILATVGANDVRGDHRAALGAGVELLGLESVMGAAHSGARIGLFALGYGHGSILTTELV